MNNAVSSAPDAGFEYLTEPQHPTAIELYDYWRSKCAGRDMPERKDIDLTELRKLAGRLLISEAVDDGTDFRVRLFGSELTELVGEERTGMKFSEIGTSKTAGGGNVKARWQAVNERAHRTRKPVFARARASREARRHLIYHGMSLPLSVDGKPAVQFLGALFSEYAA